MSRFRIDQIFIYPVKSLGGMAVLEAEIVPGGSLRGDREWIVTRPDGRMLWQGDIPRMTLLSAKFQDGKLVLSSRDGEIHLDVEERSGGATKVTQYGYELQGTDEGDVVAEWLSHQLQLDCRLIRVGAEAHRWAD